MAVCLARSYRPSVSAFAERPTATGGSWPVINFGEELKAAIDSVDPQLHQFFTSVVNSFIRLEMVVLIRRNSGQKFVPEAVSNELGWPEERVREELSHLEKSGIVERCEGHDSSYRVSSDPQVADLLNKF